MHPPIGTDTSGNVQGDTRSTTGRIGEDPRLVAEHSSIMPASADAAMRDQRLVLRTPFKQRRMNEDGDGQITQEEEGGDIDFFAAAPHATGPGFLPQGPLPPPPNAQVVPLAAQPSSSRAGAAAGVVRHQLVLLCFMLFPQGTKFMSRRTDKGQLVVPTIAVSASPTSKEAIKAIAATFIVDRFPFRLIPGIRIGRKTIAAAAGGSWHFSIGMLDVKVLFLQETKLDEHRIQQIQNWWQGPQIWAPASDTRGGCAILLHRNLNAEILDQEYDIWGRWAWVQIQLGTEAWTLMTIYAPAEPAERRSFFEELPAIVPDEDNVILAGDFNVTLTPGLDSPEVAPRKTDAVMLSNFMASRGFTDMFRTTHPTESGFTWFSSQQSENRPPPKRRLDLILAKGDPWQALATVACSIESLSDHRQLTANFELATNLARGPGTFRLNTDLLNLPGVTDWVAAHWRDWQQARPTFDTEASWLQMGLRIVTRALDTFSRIQARTRRQQEEECRTMIAEAEAELDRGPLAELYWQRRRNLWLQRLEELQVEQQMLRARRAQEKGMITGDRLTKETFQRLCPPRAHALIRELQHPFFPEAAVAKSSSEIGEHALAYFSDILRSRRQPDLTLQKLRDEHDMWQHTHVRLSSEEQAILERPIALEELWEAVKSMARGKSPGSDGLPVEFYEACWEHIGPELLSLYNRVLEGGSMTEDMKLGIITLIYKKGDKSNIRNWRPISRLNVSYKILAKLLARRLRRLAPYLPSLVHVDQGAFVQGRSIAENILAAIGALEIIQRERREVVAAMLDLEKAYDRVNWSFVLATLEHMGFGPNYRAWMQDRSKMRFSKPKLKLDCSDVGLQSVCRSSDEPSS
ncbi:hypothetical protein CBR_g609 [Chara braunii]|uniref:Reverse transcriptase domain-containing protein n=1 Tax=Chara braunii TaxID=69332 RepID=A0A388KBN8_CHABU|nr:hypothetical protein CBR_g609 [Chara braunii]|eukprot:GBG67475.1 hypothetical protein CBR_g609 [Chara braunii]